MKYIIEIDYMSWENGCDKYFEKDAWYIEYKEAIKNEEV